MAVIPKIDVLLDPEADARAFDRFLAHTYHTSLRNAIQRMYPQLIPCISMGSERTSCVQKEILALHAQRKSDLSVLAERSRVLVAERGERALLLLGRLMHWTWKDDVTYRAYISLLPGSPFNNEEYWYSALQELSSNNSENKNLLSVGIHEISHIIFLEQLRHVGVPMERDTVYVLKEALTAALLSVPEMGDVLNTASPVKGNYELHEMYVRVGGEEINVVAGVGRLMDGFSGNYSTRIHDVVSRFLKQQVAWHSHMELWRAYDRALYKDPALLAEYRIPIEL